ncbi:UNVERIFIED_CONTAM: hypothetical protein PYX00_009436 [Menopon gallinae]|uniref:Gag protein n=1 Tax=Menopon gallinae TaxID=328185 RepID=A0AAW2HBM2_9NEOP
MANFSNMSVEKLSESNYKSWKIQMKSVLIINDLWPYVDGSVPEPTSEKELWTKKDSKALAMICLCVSQKQLNYVENARTSKQAWDALREAFESTRPIRKLSLCRQLLRMKKTPSTSMNQYINEFSSKAEQLREAGIELQEELLSIMLLSSLPDNYQNFSFGIESRDRIPSLESLKVELIEEERDQESKDEVFLGRKVNQKSRGQNKEKYSNNEKFKGKCYSCGKGGHIARKLGA